MNAIRVSHGPGWGGLAHCAAWVARVAGIAALAVAGAALAQSANSIDQVAVTRGASGNTIVRFTLKAPLANPPAGFAIVSPPRIALDFPRKADLWRSPTSTTMSFAIFVSWPERPNDS